MSTEEHVKALLETLDELHCSKQQTSIIIFYLKQNAVIPQHFHECWVCRKIYNSFDGYCCEGNKEYDHV